MKLFSFILILLVINSYSLRIIARYNKLASFLSVEDITINSKVVVNMYTINPSDPDTSDIKPANCSLELLNNLSVTCGEKKLVISYLE
jgi:hypothetical protein